MPRATCPLTAGNMYFTPWTKNSSAALLFGRLSRASFKTSRAAANRVRAAWTWDTLRTRSTAIRTSGGRRPE